MEHNLLQWVAEELLGWEKSQAHGWYDRPARRYSGVDELASWHGIGLVVEAMRQRKWRLTIKLDEMSIGEHWWRAWFIPYGAQKCDWDWRTFAQEKENRPWLAVFQATRKAVENESI